jgi:hypothetical protein
MGDLLDLDAALGRGHEGDARGVAVDHHAEIELARDLAAVLDIDPAHLAPARPGLVGDQRHAEHLGGELADLLDRARELDAAALAAAAGVDLRLDHPERAVERARRGLGLLGRVDDLAAQHLDAVFLQQRLGLVFVDVHAGLVSACWPAPDCCATARPPRTGS